MFLPENTLAILLQLAHRLLNTIVNDNTNYQETCMKAMSLSQFLQPGMDYTELKIQENRSISMAMIDGTLIQNNVSAGGGLLSRTFKNGVWGLASSPIINPDSMKEVIRKAAANAEYLSIRANKGKVLLPSNTASGDYQYFTRKTLWTSQQKSDFLKELDAYIVAKYPDLTTRTLSYSQLEMDKHIINTENSELHSMTPRSFIAIVLNITHNGEPLQHHEVVGGLGQFEDNFSDPKDLFASIDSIYQILMDKKNAVFAQPGTFDVVLDSKLAGILAHEAIGHTTEADLVINGSIAGDYLNQVVASPLVTMIDIAHTWDGILCPVPVFIDDEGTTAEDCMIIENGVLKNFMQNKESAERLGQPLTGNARAFSFSDEPLIRMRNTIVVPGQDKLSEMIASIENGYYLITPSNGQADMTSEFMFGVTLGYEIKNGKLGSPIKETTISGVAFDLLKTVSMVSDDMNWTSSGMCGKKQPIPVGMGGPALKCKVNVGGKK
jgi:TldD protein